MLAVWKLYVKVVRILLDTIILTIDGIKDGPDGR